MSIGARTFSVVGLLAGLGFFSMTSGLLGARLSDTNELHALRTRLAANPHDADSMKRLASLCLSLHLESEALTTAESFRAQLSGDSQAGALLIRVLARNGRYQDAIAAFDSSPPQTRDSDEVQKLIEAARLALEADRYVRLGVASTERRDFRQAAQFLQKAVRLDPENLALRRTLGWLLLEKTHDPVAAYPELKMVVHYHPSDLGASKLLLVACSETGRFRQAVAECRKVLAIEPNELWIRFNLGKSLARLGRVNEAELVYDSSLALNPQGAWARLGKAELFAWRGHSKESTRLLRELLDEDPGNVEARALLADVCRWDWCLTQARAEYLAVLNRVEDHSGARMGLRELEQACSSQVMARGYTFTDTTDFGRSYVETSGRLRLTDKAYLWGTATRWRFDHPAFADLYRTDGMIDLEYHCDRWLDTRLQMSIYDYSNDNPFLGGQVSARLSPWTGLDVYTSCSLEHPFVSSISTVYSGLRQSSVGLGLHTRVSQKWSFQSSLELASVSDGNRWLNFRPQVSYQLLNTPRTLIRAEYELLTYSERRLEYWTPENRQLFGPGLVVSQPIAEWLLFEGALRVPYVFDRSEFGVEIRIGPTLELGRRLRAGAAFIFSSIPGDPGPWSGRGGEAFLAWHF
jgi:tetratricopeptide (TPR) repeat protein